MFLRKDPLKRARLPDVTPGAEVCTADNESLGTVAEVGEVSFKVDVPRSPDIWLGRDYVIDSAPDRVTMSFPRSELHAYKLGQPGMEPEKDTTQESLADSVIPVEEQIEQRLRMERELAEQRQRLPHTHPQGEDAPPETLGGTIGEPVEDELRDYGIDPNRSEHEEEGEFSQTGSFVEREPRRSDGRRPSGDTVVSYEPEVQARETAAGAAAPTAPGTGTTGFEYSVPTGTDDYDPAKGRRRTAGGAMGAVAAVSLAGLGFLWLMSRRRRVRKGEGGGMELDD